MKNTKIRLKSLAVVLLTLFVVCSCDPETDVNPPLPEQSCKISKISTKIVYAAGDTESSESIYNYDESKRYIGGSSESTSKDNSGAVISTYTSTSKLTFDTDGFVIGAISSTTTFTDEEFLTRDTVEYLYQDGKLVELNTNQAFGPFNYLYHNVYDYEGSKLIKYTASTTMVGFSTSTNTFDFVSKKLTMISGGGKETAGLLSDEGYILKELNPAGVERRYTYDDGLLTRTEQFQKDKMFHFSTATYDGKINPRGNNSSALKGVPELKFYRNVFPVQNYKTQTEVDVDVDGNETVETTTTYESEYNAAGYITKIVAVKKDGKGALISTTTTEYMYNDCK